MDAAGILKAHGWRGTGHSLDSTDRGLKKPLLVSHKQDLLGIGKKKNLVSDQWWMRAFDESLKELGSGKKTTLQQVSETGIARGGLYGFFVKGESLEGTIDSKPVTTSNTSVSSSPSPSDSTSVSSSGTSTPATSSDNIPSVTMAKAKKPSNKRRASEISTTEETNAPEHIKKPKLDLESGPNQPSTKEQPVDERYEKRLRKLQLTRQKLAERDAAKNNITVEQQMERLGWDKNPPKTFGKVKTEFIHLKNAKRHSIKYNKTIEQVFAEEAAKQRGVERRKAKPKKEESPPLEGVLATLPPAKIVQYKARALEKGLSLEDYLKQRRVKNAKKKKLDSRGEGFISFDAEDDDGEEKPKPSWIRLMRDKILTQQGKNPEEATKEELVEARKLAKREMKRNQKKKKDTEREKKKARRQTGRNN